MRPENQEEKLEIEEVMSSKPAKPMSMSTALDEFCLVDQRH